VPSPLSETRPHLARIDQLVAVVEADQERAERPGRGGRAAPAANRSAAQALTWCKRQSISIFG
jgi:hypothetical protein